MHISFFNKYFYKNKQSKLCFEDRVAVLNVIYFLYGGSINMNISLVFKHAALAFCCLLYTFETIFRHWHSVWLFKPTYISSLQLFSTPLAPFLAPHCG